MATEIVTSKPIIEEEVHGDVKTIEQECVTSIKDNGEEKKVVEEEKPTPEVVELTEKKLESPVIEEVKKINEEEKLKTEDLPVQVAASAEPEMCEEKETESPVIVDDVKKTDEEEEKPKVEELPVPVVAPAEPDTSEEKEIEEVKKSEEEEKCEEVKKAEEEEKPNIEDLPVPAESAVCEEKEIETPISTEEEPKVEELSVPVVAPAEPDKCEEKDIGSPLIEEIKNVEEEEKPKADNCEVIEDVKKAEELLTAVCEEKKTEVPVAEQVKNVEEEKEKVDEETPIVQVACVESLDKMEEKKIEPAAIEVVKDEEKPIQQVPPIECEQNNELEGKIGEKEIAPLVKCAKENVEDKLVEEPKECCLGVEIAKPEEVKDYTSSRDFQQVAENGMKTEETEKKEEIKTEVIPLVETPACGNEEDAKKTEVEVKGDESEKTEAPISGKKHSNSIMGKVKQTLVKAKKAIIGKSPTPKTPPTETKGEQVEA